MSSSLKTLSQFLTGINPQVYLSEKRLENTIEQELGSLKTLEEKVQELAKMLSLNSELDQDAVKSIEKIRMLSESPNPAIKRLFQRLYQPFAPLAFDREIEAFKKKDPVTITDQDIGRLFDLRNQLPSAQLATLVHILSDLTEQLRNNEGLVDCCKAAKEAMLEQLKRTQVATFKELQLEVDSLKQKSYLNQEDRKTVFSVLLSTGVKDSAFDKMLEKESPAAALDYQAFKTLFHEAPSFSFTIQGRLWTPSMVQTLINTHLTLEQFQQEFNKKLLIELANNESLELEPHQKYLLMQHSSFYSLWTSGMKETHEGKVALENISKEAFSRILADLNQKPDLPSDEISLLERALFCKKWGLDTLADQYEKELCVLVGKSRLKTILELNNHAFGLEKLKKCCQDKISLGLTQVFKNNNPQELQKVFNFLRPYAPSIDTLQLCECKFSVEHLRQITKAFPNLISLDLFHCNITKDGLKELSSLTNLTSLTLHECNGITDAGLKELSKNLISLNLYWCENITDAGLKALSKNLTSLHVNRCKNITDASLKELPNLTNLTSLNLSDCTNIELKEIPILTNLTFLNLSDCYSIKDDGIAALSSNLTNLTYLNLSGLCNTTDASLRKLSTLKNLASLNVGKCGSITNACLQDFSTLTNLTYLNLERSQEINNTGLQWLSKLPKLASLNLSDCKKITDANIQEFKTLRPGTQIKRVDQLTYVKYG